jgi:hypothetical protein
MKLVDDEVGRHKLREAAMNLFGTIPVVLALAACTQSASTDTADSLMRHPDRLHEVERRCANDLNEMPIAECDAASEARRRLFMGNGAQYTPSKDAAKF